MTDSHREALQVARNENRVIGAYLQVLEHNQKIDEQNRPKRGRRRSTESMQARLDEIVGAIGKASPLKRVLLIQEQMDLQKELHEATRPPQQPIDISGMEEGFSEVVASFSKRKGVSYAAWREIGVPARVLKEAGIRRTRRDI